MNYYLSQNLGGLMTHKIRYRNAICTNSELIYLYLMKCSTANIALVDNGKPYIIPMAYVWHDNKLYFHGSSEGRKNDVIHENGTSCVSITEENGFTVAPVPANASTSYFSIYMEGETKVVTDLKESTEVLQLMLQKYLPNYYSSSLKETLVDKYRSSLNSRTETFVFLPEFITAKNSVASIKEIYFGGRTNGFDAKLDTYATELEKLIQF